LILGFGFLGVFAICLPLVRLESFSSISQSSEDISSGRFEHPWRRSGALSSFLCVPGEEVAMNCCLSCATNGAGLRQGQGVEIH